MMYDREKIIPNLEMVKEEIRISKQDTWFSGNKKVRFMRYVDDALELLKEQEPVEAKTMGESKSHGSWWFACGACGHAIDPEDNYCRNCGRKVKWDD